MSIHTKPNETDSLKEIILDKDKQLDKEVSGSAFSLVALSYFVVLLAVAGVVIFFWLSA